MIIPETTQTLITPLPLQLMERSSFSREDLKGIELEKFPQLTRDFFLSLKLGDQEINAKNLQQNILAGKITTYSEKDRELIINLLFSKLNCDQLIILKPRKNLETLIKDLSSIGENPYNISIRHVKSSDPDNTSPHTMQPFLEVSGIRGTTEELLIITEKIRTQFQNYNWKLEISSENKK